MTDSFTAVAVCPQCELAAVHPFRMPRQRPPNYEPGVVKTIHERDGSTTRITSWGMRDVYAMEEAATVVRQCTSCGHEWANR